MEVSNILQYKIAPKFLKIIVYACNMAAEI